MSWGRGGLTIPSSPAQARSRCGKQPSPRPSHVSARTCRREWSQTASRNESSVSSLGRLAADMVGSGETRIRGKCPSNTVTNLGFRNEISSLGRLAADMSHEQGHWISSASGHSSPTVESSGGCIRRQALTSDRSSPTVVGIPAAASNTAMSAGFPRMHPSRILAAASPSTTALSLSWQENKP